MLVDCQDFDQMKLDFVAWLSEVNRAACSNCQALVPVDAQLEAIKARAELLLSIFYQSQAECTGF